MKLLIVAEVAEQLSCAASTVYQLISTGKLAGFRIGANHGGIRISESDLEAYLESCRLGEGASTKSRSSRLRHLNQ